MLAQTAQCSALWRLPGGCRHWLIQRSIRRRNRLGKLAVGGVRTGAVGVGGTAQCGEYADDRQGLKLHSMKLPVWKVPTPCPL